MKDPSPGPSVSPAVIRLLAGLDVGLFAGLPAIAWLLFHSWLRGEPWWAKLNVFAALFFKDSVYTMGFSRATLAGCALIIAAFTLLGVGYSLIARLGGVTRNLLLGLLVAVASQAIFQRYLVFKLDPFAPGYFPSLATWPALLMYGIGLARFAPRFQTLAAAWGPAVPEPPILGPIPDSLAEEVDIPILGPIPDPPADEKYNSEASLTSLTPSFPASPPTLSTPDSQENTITLESSPKAPKPSGETDC